MAEAEHIGQQEEYYAWLVVGKEVAEESEGQKLGK